MPRRLAPASEFGIQFAQPAVAQRPYVSRHRWLRQIAKDIGLTDSGGAPGALVRTGRFEEWTSGCAAAGRDFAWKCKSERYEENPRPVRRSTPNHKGQTPFGCPGSVRLRSGSAIQQKDGPDRQTQPSPVNGAQPVPALSIDIAASFANDRRQPSLPTAATTAPATAGSPRFYRLYP